MLRASWGTSASRRQQNIAAHSTRFTAGMSVRQPTLRFLALSNPPGENPVEPLGDGICRNLLMFGGLRPTDIVALAYL